jgi:hypothetical protein
MGKIVLGETWCDVSLDQLLPNFHPRYLAINTSGPSLIHMHQNACI